MVNGELSASQLTRIPGGRLRSGAPAKSYLAMRYFIARRTKGSVWLRPTGPISSYRDIQGQRLMWQRYMNGGPVAARPGTSLHGWGRAVDLPSSEMQRSVRTVGHLFGWGIAGGQLSTDAPSESWHMRWVDVNGNGRMTAKARWWWVRWKLASKRRGNK